MAGGSGWRGAAALLIGLASGGCVRDNPAWHEGAGASAGASTTTGSEGASATATSEGASAGASTSGSSSTSAGTEEPTTTAIASDPTGVGPTSDATTDATTDASGDATGDATTSEGDTSTNTGEPPPVCGAGAFGEATMVARRVVNGVEQGCGDLAGRHYLVAGVQGEFVKAYACAVEPGVGCGGCNFQDVLFFNVKTPVPDGVLATTPCVYIELLDGVKVEPNGPCRYAQMAIWHSGDLFPAKAPPAAILGHGTVSAPPAIAELHGSSLKVVASDQGAACACADPRDCCPELAAEYVLDFFGDDELALSPGMEGQLTFLGDAYGVYNGNSQEPGTCAPAQAIDWWLLRL